MHTATEQAANLVNSLHEHEMERREPFVVLLDVAKAFVSTIREVIFSIVNHAGLPPNCVTAFRTIYAHTDTCTDIQGERIYLVPTRGVKEGCPCFLLLFAIVYELLIKRLIAKCPHTFVYVDDIAIIVKDCSQLGRLLTDLSAWGSQIGIQFNPNKIEVWYFHKPRSWGATVGGAQQAKHIRWGPHRLDFKDTMFTYLGHTSVGVGYRGKARDALFAALQAHVAAYTILRLTSFERAQMVNSVLIPRWLYKSLFMWDVPHGDRLRRVCPAGSPRGIVPAVPHLHGRHGRRIGPPHRIVGWFMRPYPASPPGLGSSTEAYDEAYQLRSSPTHGGEVPQNLAVRWSENGAPHSRRPMGRSKCTQTGPR